MARGWSLTSLIERLDGPEDSVGQLCGDVNEGHHVDSGIQGMLNPGSKLVHDVPHWNQLQEKRRIK